MWEEHKEASLLLENAPNEWITDNHKTRRKLAKKYDREKQTAIMKIQQASMNMARKTHSNLTNNRKSTDLRNFMCGDIISLPSDNVWKVPRSEAILKRVIQGRARNESLMTITKRISKLKSIDIVLFPPIKLIIDEHDHVDLQLDKQNAMDSFNKMNMDPSIRVGVGTISITVSKRPGKGVVFEPIHHSMTILISNDVNRRIAYIVDSNGDASKKVNGKWAYRTFQSIEKLLKSMNLVIEINAVEIPNINFTPNASINKLLESYGLLESREHGFCAVFSFLFVIEVLCSNARSLLKGHFSRMIFIDLLRRKSIPGSKTTLTESEKVEVIMYTRALALSLDRIIRPRIKHSHITIERTYQDGIPKLSKISSEKISAKIRRRLRIRNGEDLFE